MQRQESTVDVEDTENDRRAARSLYPQWTHRGGPGGRIAKTLRLGSRRSQPRAGFARGGVGGSRGRAVSGPVRSNGYHTYALPGLYPRVDRERKRPAVSV